MLVLGSAVVVAIAGEVLVAWASSGGAVADVGAGESEDAGVDVSLGAGVGAVGAVVVAVVVVVVVVGEGVGDPLPDVGEAVLVVVAGTCLTFEVTSMVCTITSLPACFSLATSVSLRRVWKFV